ncbi:MAG: cobalamin B12-binding domain-containing protein [Lentisphaerae bacterium]|nr:cobalamin B12-binding domain-containing protein [Lentisphaerota bacterium]
MSQTDLLIVRPGNQKSLYGDLSARHLTGIEPPLWAALQAAFIRQQGFSVEIIDAEVLLLSHAETAEKIKALKPALVQVAVSGTNPSASTWNMTGAGVLLRHLKGTAPELKTIISGLHPSALPERTLKEEAVDYVCQGEGFHTIRQLLQMVKANALAPTKVPGLWYRDNGRVASTPRAPLIKQLDELPMPAWDLLPMAKYRAHNWHCLGGKYDRQPYGVIYTSLGCPYTCSFCCINSFFGKNLIRYRSPEKVVEEIRFLARNYGIRNIRIIDEMFVLRSAHVLKLCDLIIGAGFDLNMWVYARVDTVSAEMLQKMKLAGINWVCYGFESANQAVLDSVRKGYAQTDVYEAVRLTRAAGINILANYMFGLPDDNLPTMQQTLEQAKELNCEFANFYCCMAYPGSKLYDQALAQGARLPDSWEGYSQLSPETLPLPTKHLTSAEVLHFRDQAFQNYFSNPAYLAMIEKKFGPSAAAEIKKMLQGEIKRKYA